MWIHVIKQALLKSNDCRNSRTKWQMKATTGDKELNGDADKQMMKLMNPLNKSKDT